MSKLQTINLPTDAKRRLRTAAHRSALRFENAESLRLLAELRQLVKDRADADVIEQFVSDAEVKSCG